MTLSLAAAALMWGCPSDKPTPTPGPAAAPPGHPASAPAGAGSQPAGHAASQPAPGAASRPAGAPAAEPAAPSSKPFSGLVKLADGVTPDMIKPTDVLFIMARTAVGPNQAGALVAVQRHSAVKEWPMRYEMSSANLMMPGMPFSGPFIVQARLDRDGDPMTKAADDLYADYEGSVQGGAEGVHLVLAKRTPSGAPSSQPASQPAH